MCDENGVNVCNTKEYNYLYILSLLILILQIIVSGDELLHNLKKKLISIRIIRCLN